MATTEALSDLEILALARASGIDVDAMAPLVRFNTIYSTPKRQGYLPASEWMLRDMVERDKIRTVRLGPASLAMRRPDLLRIMLFGFSVDDWNGPKNPGRTHRRTAKTGKAKAKTGKAKAAKPGAQREATAVTAP